MSSLSSPRVPMRSLRWTDLAAFPLVLGLSVLPLLWFGQNWEVGTDPSRYLLLGWNLISGEGYTFYGAAYTLRGPVFSGFLGGLMLLFGRDVESLAWAVRISTLANPVLVYYLIKRIAGPIAGLLAAALIALFGYTATQAGAFSVDAFQLTVYLLAILVMLTGSQRNSASLWLLSGLLLGTAVLIKETSLGALPLALFAALLFGWSLRGLLLHYAGVVAVCLPWWVWVWFVSGKAYLISRLPSGLTVAAIAAVLAIAAVITLTAFSVIWGYKPGMVARMMVSERWRGLIGWSAVLAPVAVLSVSILMRSGRLSRSKDDPLGSYIVEQLGQDIRLWYLLPFAGAYVLWETIRGDRFWGFYFALLVLQVPISLIVLQEQWATRQWLVPQTLLYGALAGLVVKVLRASTRHERHNLHRSVAFGAGSVLVVVLVWTTVVQVHYLLDGAYEAVNDETYRARIDSKDEFNSAVRDMHNWIEANIPEGEKIVVTRHYASQLAFLDGMQHKWTLLQVDGCRGTPDGTCRPGSKEIAQAPPQPTVWFELDGNCNGMALSLTALMHQMEGTSPTYLLTTQEKEAFPSNLAAAPYLKSSGAFEVVYSSYLPGTTTTERSHGLVLLKRTGRNPTSSPTLIKTRMVDNLIRCKKTAWGKRRYEEKIRESFPSGIEVLGPQSKLEPAQRRIEKIYGAQ